MTCTDFWIIARWSGSACVGPLVVRMAHELPAAVARRARDALVVDAHARVDRERRLDVEAVERFFQPPEPDAIAVLVPRPVRQVRQLRDARRRRQHLARHRARDVPHFGVDDRPHDEARIARQLERRAIDDRGILKAL